MEDLISRRSTLVDVRHSQSALIVQKPPDLEGPNSTDLDPIQEQQSQDSQISNDQKEGARMISHGLNDTMSVATESRRGTEAHKD